MKTYIITEDLIEQLDRMYGGQMTDLCMTPLGVKNWLKENALFPVQLHICSKETPDPELEEVISLVTCALYGDYRVSLAPVLRYLEQLRLLKAEYARVFF